MNLKFYIVIFIMATAIITVGMIVSKSYINKAPEAESGISGKLLSDQILNKTESPAPAEEVVEERFVDLPREGDRTVVKGQLPPQGKKLLKELDKLNQDLKKDLGEPEFKKEIKTDAELATIIAEGNELITKVDREYDLDTRSHLKK